MSIKNDWTPADVVRAIERIAREVPTARVQTNSYGYGLAAIRGGSPKDGACIIFDPVAGFQADLNEAIAWLKGGKFEGKPMFDPHETKQ